MSTVLVVDDDPDIANIFKTFLSLDGHTALTASDGMICLEKVRQCKFDLILLDIMMAPMDGWETLEHIKSDPQTSSIPVIMVTGKPLLDNERAKYQNLFYHYLMKPVCHTELCDIVKDALKNN